MSTAPDDDGLGIVTMPSLVYGRDDVPVVYRPALPLTAARARYTGFRRESLVLRKGTVRRDGARPLECDIHFDRDVPIQLRDGTTIYTDIFRPVHRTDCPAPPH